ncbi:MAG: hypothetical protein VXZ38_12040 [Planctomycetota bacterium]|nr:hypothetical protein [Planctomycetota bacterium]
MRPNIHYIFDFLKSMKHTLLIAIFLCCVQNRCRAEEQIADPSDTPPVLGMAIADPDPDSDYYSVELTVPKVRWKVVGEKRTKLEWPELKVKTDFHCVSVLMTYDQSKARASTQLNNKAQNRVVDISGKRLSSDQVLQRLKSETAVLVSVSGNMPDRYYLQTTRQDTLIIILGILSDAPTPELLPARLEP